jgi:hypothetical protein
MEVNFLAAFDDQLIMDVSNDEAVGESLHGIAEDVPADCLNDVLDKFGAIRFDALPGFCASDAIVADGFSAEAVLSKPWVDIAEPSSRRQGDEEDAVLVGELDAADLRPDVLPDSCFDRLIDSSPELHNMRIGLSPEVYQRLQFFFMQSHFQSSHRFQGSDRSAVSEGEFCNLAFLAEVSIDPMLDYWHAEHLGSGGAVNVFSFRKYLGTPFFSGDVGEYPGFNGGVVADNKYVSRPWDEGGPDQLRERVRDIVI